MSRFARCALRIQDFCRLNESEADNGAGSRCIIIVVNTTTSVMPSAGSTITRLERLTSLDIGQSSTTSQCEFHPDFDLYEVLLTTTQCCIYRREGDNG